MANKSLKKRIKAIEQHLKTPTRFRLVIKESVLKEMPFLHKLYTSETSDSNYTILPDDEYEERDRQGKILHVGRPKDKT